MESPSEAAARILDCCRRAAPWPDHLLRELVEAAERPEASRAIFRDLVEPLCDAFEPALCDRYAEVFSDAIAQVQPGWSARELRARYARIRRTRPVLGDFARVFVLSRVTLGADVAVTSVVLDAVKKRFPRARIALAGNRKSHELFDADPRIEFLEAPYSRTGLLRDRLEAGLRLRPLLDGGDALVVDPDSRLSQLGLLPVADERRYTFFESRSAGGGGQASLGELTRDWVRETFGVEDARAFIAPASAPVCDDEGLTAVSFGAGENPAKRIAGDFERELLANLIERGEAPLLDEGAGGEEAERARALAAAFAGKVRTWSGAFAPFAASIRRARQYVGYDSAGQHVAAACGTPLLTVFAGFVSERMFQRWSPSGPSAIEVVKAVGGPVMPEAAAAFERLRSARVRP